MVYAVTGAWASEFTWTSSDSEFQITATNVQVGPDDNYQKVVVNTPGALAAFITAVKENNELWNSLGNNGRVNLQIEGELNSDDFSALNSSEVEGWGTFTSLDLKNATIADMAVITNSSMNMGNLKYMRLPSNLTDVNSMESLKTLNASLDMVVSISDLDTNLPKAYINSFTANSILSVSNVFKNGYNGFEELKACKYVTMTGYYGETDLVYNNTKNFGDNVAVWDFSGAHFADCTISAVDAKYYNYDDPFCEHDLVAPSTSSNAFYYFSFYATKVVDIKLPDNNMKHLPVLCLSDLGASNKDGYVAIYGSDAFEANKAEANCVPLESLRIPDCYTDLDQECGKWARIRHLVVGSGMKRIHGGAFLKCDFLEDLDFAAGLSDCYVGDRAFNECKSMKHIALSEGIVSLGNGAFWNSQHLESIRLPQTLINIGNNALKNCLALSSITIPENVDKIGQNAFELCPFTDIYLTTTDPNKIPLVWSAGISPAGNGFGSFDSHCSFNHGHVDGWEGIPDTPQKPMLETMSFDEAADWYFIHVNGIPVLHYPKELFDAVRAGISATYEGTSTDDYGLPFRSDMFKRSNVEGADLGTIGTGKYTRDGWAQFMLMKEFTTDPGGDVYTKEYDDVWYTMCFPFDLTDEQLAAAFNETFNIVDFSGVEVDKDNKALILHFNNVALTDYKDIEGNHYKRKTNGDEIIREKDETSGFFYNVYIYKDENNVEHEFHHVNTSSQLSSNKTKTFAEGTSIADAQSNFNSNKTARLIDGILATAGHPYMIHPAIGVNDGGTTKRRCDFAGITWLPQSEWAEAFAKNSRTIDLGVKKTLEELPDSNYNQSAYDGYAGQTYTFVGNAKSHAAGAPEEPTVANGQLTPYNEKPTRPAYDPEPTKEPYPEEPTMAPEPEAPTSTEITEEPTLVEDPSLDTETYPQNFQTLMSTVRCTFSGWDNSVGANVTRDYTYGDDLPNGNYSIDEFLEYHDYNTVGYYYKSPNAYLQSHSCNLSAAGEEVFKAYLGSEPISEAAFNALKTLATNYVTAKSNHDTYLANLAIYNEWQTYHSQHDDWVANAESNYQTAHSNWETACSTIESNYQTAHSNWEAACATIDANYALAFSDWEDECETIDETNDAIIAAWEESAKGYLTQIPKNAYFLGRKAGQYPKYYRERSDESYGGTRTSGLWPQFTAVVIPNTAAINGIEKKIDSGTALSKGFEMKFNEDFEGDFIDEGDIQTIIEDARKEGVEPKVEYMDVVVNINGQVVRRDSTSFEGLPKGIYIVNGKKYFVK